MSTSKSLYLPTFQELFFAHSAPNTRGQSLKLRVAISPDGAIHFLDIKLPVRNFNQVDEFLKLKGIPTSPLNGLTTWTRVRISEDHYMYVDDDGYYKRLAYNPIASRLYAESLVQPSLANPILGSVWICHSKDVL